MTFTTNVNLYCATKFSFYLPSAVYFIHNKISRFFISHIHKNRFWQLLPADFLIWGISNLNLAFAIFRKRGCKSLYSVSQKFVPLLSESNAVRLVLISKSFKEKSCLFNLFYYFILVVPSFDSDIRFVYFRAKGARARACFPATYVFGWFCSLSKFCMSSGLILRE